MKREWRLCPRGDVVGQWSAIYVTMSPRGHIAMSRVVYEKLGSPNAFHLLFDKVNNCIGMKPTQRKMKDAYPVGPQGSHGGKVVRAYRLMQEFGIQINQTVRFHDAEIDSDGILVLDLRSAKVSSRAQAYAERQRRHAPPQVSTTA